MPRELRCVAILTLASLGRFGCKEEDQNRKFDTGPNAGPIAAGGGEILIGEYASMTGDTATFGISSHEGVMLAVEEINANGGVLGKQIKIITEDDQSKAEEANNAVQKLINRDKVVAILGEIASKRSLAAGAGLPEVRRCRCSRPAAPIPTSPRSATTSSAPASSTISRALVCGQFRRQKALEESSRSSTDVQSDYSQGPCRSSSSRRTQKGGTDRRRRELPRRPTSTSTRQLTKIKAANPDAIFVPGYYTEAGLIAARRASWESRCRSSAATGGTATRRSIARRRRQRLLLLQPLLAG